MSAGSSTAGLLETLTGFYHVSVPIVTTLIVVLGSLSGLYIWVASRQVRRPKKHATSFDDTSQPSTPLGRHMRRTQSFSEADLEIEVKKQSKKDADEQSSEDEEEGGDKWAAAQGWSTGQLEMFKVLRQKFFSNADCKFVGELIGNVEVLTLETGDVIFGRRKYDGSLLFVSSGSVWLSAFHEDRSFVHTIKKHEGVTSTSAILRGVLEDKFEGLDMQAVAAESPTLVLRISVDKLKTTISKYPQIAIFLAHLSLSQLERITMRSLIDYFGYLDGLFCPMAYFDVLKNDSDTVRGIAMTLGLDYVELQTQFAGATQIRSLEDGSLVEMPSGTEDDDIADVYFVLEGAVSVEILLCHQSTNDDEFVSLFKVSTGCCLGMASAIVGNTGLLKARSVMQAKAVGRTRVVQLNGGVFRSMLQTHPAFFNRCVQTVVRQYGSQAALLDNFFERVHVDSGDAIYHVGDSSNAMYTLLTGRLREVHSQTSSTGTVVKNTRELVKGATLGAMDLLASSKRASTVYAIRDCQVSKMPRVVLDYMLRAQPQVLIHFTRQMAIHNTDRSDNEFVSSQANRSPMKLPVTTIAVLSATKGVSIHEFTTELHKALQTIATTEVVSSSKAERHFNGQWRSLGMSAWLAEMESSHQLVVFEADAVLTPWTKLCIRQADHILLVCKDTDQELDLKDLNPLLLQAYSIKNVEVNIVRMKSTTAHGSANTPPLHQVEYVNYFHNIRMPLHENTNDMLRVARRLTGRSIGLVLGGGGARGLAHIGILKALEECGLDVDVVGGTSMGALIAALYAQYPKDLERVIKHARRFSSKAANKLAKLFELTLPIASWFDGSSFNTGLQLEFGMTRIEDLVLNFFCISTDIVKKCTGVHRSGTLWRYVRASMSLQGYLPPISEPSGSLLLDGGYVNNLPADVMKEEGVKIVFAVDVGRDNTRDYFHYGDTLSGWWVFLNKLNPFTPTVQVPSMGEITDALAYAAFYQNKAYVINHYVDLYFKPPVQAIGTLEFDKLDLTIQLGYDYALPKIKDWMKKNPHLVTHVRQPHGASATGRSNSTR
ncbi:hypothetical protein, variant [Aphanomyces invadans]|uniref:Patatin n=1 Tax=Aphanomyces invadans TaxID=157072 RepID=A0A024USK8_9STRA|nr:hypothetical protein, variant [Aphanomyces invadans]ETW08910.1 hypothetical protein, variant [Aphanomyces invadans]|eukprot:XP_008862715.1 hypothetical protein, variant [Aphanomyces invadans]